MYRRDAPYIAEQLAYLKAHRDWASRWRSVLRESVVGDPRPFVDYRRSSGNLIYQAYNVCLFEDVTGVRLSSFDFIFEFGGGYGAFCRLLCELGFRGTFAIFDLPEFGALQRLYLRSHGLPVVSRPAAKVNGLEIVTLSTLDELDALVGPRPAERAAFVALWSLSETPLPLREAVIARLTRFDAFAVGYQAHFHGIDNVEWFGAARGRLGRDVDWYDQPLPQSTSDVRHLFGARKPRTGRPR